METLRFNSFFTPKSDEYIYVESSFDRKINENIRENLDRISSTFGKWGKRFIYIPEFLEKFDTSHVLYNAPRITPMQLNDWEKLKPTAEEVYWNIIGENAPKDIHCLIVGGDKGFSTIDLSGQENAADFCCKYITDLNNVSYSDLSESTDKPTLQANRITLSAIDEGDIIRYSTLKDDVLEVLTETDSADQNFPYEVMKLENEIRERISKMRELGVNELLIKSFCKKLASPAENKPSRVHITKYGRIFLSDYNDIEIKMTPLVKSVYFLFLRYPNGLFLKDLADHREELTDFYIRLSNRFDIQKLEESIDSITDSTKNSINEKCSRIREAFISQIRDEFVFQYYISGERMEPKKILINRELVRDDFGILNTH